MKKIFFSWVGGTDWRSFEDDGHSGPGPVLATLSDPAWSDADEVHLINNYSDRQASEFADWLKKKSGCNAVPHDVVLSSPTNWGEIYDEVINIVEPLSEGNELTFLCSPGTYVMAAVWILISQTKFQNVRLLETSKEAGVVEIKVPFTISADYFRDEQRREALSGIDRRVKQYFSDIKYRCEEMRTAILRANRIASSKLNVLLEGEAGTGKALFAKAIHEASRQTDDRNLVSIDCAQYTADQLERELFGIELDAARGERQRKKSIFERANKSTLYIAEVQAIPPNLQVKLLRAIMDKEVTPINSVREYKFDVRFIFGCRKPLGEEVRQGKMSLELYYQITEDVIKLPPLRDRGEDLELIADDQFEKLKLSLTGEPGNIEKKKLSVGAKKALKAHDFPGNLRELSNVLTRALIHSAKDTITQEEIEEATGVARLQHANGDILDRAINKDFRLEDVLNEVKVHYIQRAERIGGGVVKASALLGIKNYQTLAKWKKDLGLNPE